MPTNLVIDARSFAVINIEGLRFTCVACGRQHIWSKQDAWVDGAEPPAPAR